MTETPHGAEPPDDDVEEVFQGIFSRGPGTGRAPDGGSSDSAGALVRAPAGPPADPKREGYLRFLAASEATALPPGQTPPGQTPPRRTPPRQAVPPRRTPPSGPAPRNAPPSGNPPRQGVPLHGAIGAPPRAGSGRGVGVGFAIVAAAALTIGVILGVTLLPGRPGSRTEAPAPPVNAAPPAVIQAPPADDAPAGSGGPDDGQAAAGTFRFTTFALPSRNIVCAIADAGLVLCGIAERTYADPTSRPADCSEEFGNVIAARGDQVFFFCGPAPVARAADPTLEYGESTSAYGVVCTSRTTGVRCVTTAGNGFSLARSGYQIF